MFCTYQQLPKSGAGACIENNGTAAQAKDVYQEAFTAVAGKHSSDKFHPESETALSGYLRPQQTADFLRPKSPIKVIPIDNKPWFIAEPDPKEGRENDYITSVPKKTLL